MWVIPKNEEGVTNKWRPCLLRYCRSTSGQAYSFFWRRLCMAFFARDGEEAKWETVLQYHTTCAGRRSKGAVPESFVSMHDQAAGTRHRLGASAFFFRSIGKQLIKKAQKHECKITRNFPFRCGFALAACASVYLVVCHRNNKETNTARGGRRTQARVTSTNINRG